MANAEQRPAENAFVPSEARAAATVVFLRERFGDAILDVVEWRGDTTILVAAGRIAEVAQAIRDAPSLRYNFLSDVTAVDWLEREPRYDIVYQIQSLDTLARVTLKIQAGDEDIPDPEVPTVTAVWPSANWFEREVFDLFGIRFVGHPNLTRILMPTDWVGHPLRKDYPITGFSLPEPHWGGQMSYSAPLPEGTGKQTLRTERGLEERTISRTAQERDS